MEQVIKLTGDGSKTIFVPGLNEHYHSTYGAVQESMHVFIKNGLQLIKTDEPKILEMGFGTGLNALLTLLEGKRFKKIEYSGVELYPIEWEKVILLEYQNFLKISSDQNEMYKWMHTSSWNENISINSSFTLNKLNRSIPEFYTDQKFDLVYFDAFAPDVQPELWTTDIFQKIFDFMNTEGILVTYCAKGEVRRILQHCGLEVERLAGPPGKREMLRAVKK